MQELEIYGNSVGDLIEEFTPLLAKAVNSHHITEHDAPMFLSQMREGVLRVAKSIAETQLKLSTLKVERKKLESLLRLEEFPEYAKERGIKGTENDKDAFINSHPDAINLAMEEIKWEQILSYLQSVRYTLTTAHNDTKASVYTKTYDIGRVEIRG